MLLICLFNFFTRLIRSFKYCRLKIYGCLKFRFCFTAPKRNTQHRVEDKEEETKKMMRKKLFSLFEIVMWGECVAPCERAYIESYNRLLIKRFFIQMMIYNIFKAICYVNSFFSIIFLYRSGLHMSGYFFVSSHSQFYIKKIFNCSILFT